MYSIHAWLTIPLIFARSSQVASAAREDVSAAIIVGHFFASVSRAFISLSLDLFISLSLDLSISLSLDLFLSLFLDLSISLSLDLSISLSLDLSISLALDLSFASGRMVFT